MIIQAALIAVLSIAQATAQPAPQASWEVFLLEQVSSGKIPMSEYMELLKQLDPPATPSKSVPDQNQTTWFLGAAAAILVLEVRLRKFLSTLLRGVLENMRPFFKDVLKEALEDKEKDK